SNYSDNILSRFKLGHPIFQKSFFRINKPSLYIIKIEKRCKDGLNFLTFNVLFQNTIGSSIGS
ncbi:MAG TPA: hypothetical protein VJL78_05535, partial [Candidatus Nitrosocosmicus sp.]|nr:hypothetical protein [Candidatus Nitrosocosmicus sp.]